MSDRKRTERVSLYWREPEAKRAGEKLILTGYPPSQKTTGVSPWMNAHGGPFEARRAKEGASADSAEERKDTTGVNPWRLHFLAVKIMVFG